MKKILATISCLLKNTNQMKHILFLPLFILLISPAFAQKKYSVTADIQPEYKDKYTFKATLDDKTNILSLETNAPVTKVLFSTYTPEELAVRKGKEYTNTFTKKGRIYSYDLKKPLLKNKYAYWLKLFLDNNESLVAEYFFRKKNSEKIVSKVPEPKVEIEVVPTDDKTEDDQSRPVLKTNITCEAGKTKVIKAVKVLDGVIDIKIDIKTGLLKLYYSSDGSPLIDIIEEINNAGFDVLNDVGWGIKKSANPSANPCKTKTAK